MVIHWSFAIYLFVILAAVEVIIIVNGTVVVTKLLFLKGGGGHWEDLKHAPKSERLVRSLAQICAVLLCHLLCIVTLQ